MGRQVNFFMDTQDHLEFLRWVLSRAENLIFDSRSTTSMPQQILDPIHDIGSRIKRKCCVIRREDVGDLKLDPVGDNDYRVDTRRSPVVEFSPSIRDGVNIRRGRLFFDGGYYSEGNVWHSKPEKFCMWANQLLAWVPQHFANEVSDGVYIGPDAKKAVETEQVHLRSF